MYAVQDTIERIMSAVRMTGQASSSAVKAFTCPKCMDNGFVIESSDESADIVHICECQEVLSSRRMLESMGISRALRGMSFANYIPWESQTRSVKSMAEEYCMNFLSLEVSRRNSICFLGQSGSGKTHLGAAIMNTLFDEGIAVIYMPYRSAITELKQNVLDDEAYSRLMGRYKKARVLLIDDFAKGTKSPADVNYMFDIINDRYLNNGPIILSSELDMDGIIGFDQAVGARIIEMCRGHIGYFHGEDKNYRLRK